MLPACPSHLPAQFDCLQVVSDPNMDRSGVYWSWNGNSGSFENDVSEEVGDAEKGKKLFELSQKLVGLA